MYYVFANNIADGECNVFGLFIQPSVRLSIQPLFVNSYFEWRDIYLLIYFLNQKGQKTTDIAVRLHTNTQYNKIE